MPKFKIQRIELNETGSAVHCPFCGHKVTNALDTANEWLAGEPCKHTLFVATDEDFEYKSEALSRHIDGLLAACKDSEEREDFEECNIDELTDKIELQDALKFAIYTGPPAVFGTYIGFSADKPE